MRARILAGVLAALLLAACGGAEVVDTSGGGAGSEGASTDGGDDGGALTIAVVPKAIGFDFWEQVRLGAECAAERAGEDGREVQIQWDGVTAETDVTGQVNLLQNFVTQGVDGLVFAATDAAVLADVSDQAIAAGIPTVNVDSGTDPQPDEVPVFATDNVAGAEQAADFLADALGPEGGPIAFIPFQPGTVTNDQRTEGFRNGLEAHPELDLVAEQSSQSDQATALQVTEDILTANPALRGIFAANEPGVLGAVEAVRNAGRDGEITVIGWDASPDQIAALEDGVITALVVQNPFRMGFDGVNAVLAKIDGEDVASGDTGVTYVTQENLEDEDVQATLAPTCETFEVGP